MHLVSPLVAGIKGAENGTAEIYGRDTLARAVYWLDFEGTSAIVTGLDVALDSHGGAAVYVDELCDIVVKTSGGAVLRSFVAGVAATVTEVVSQSFHGTDYTSGVSDFNEPTTLDQVLDLWLTINGGTDWQIAIPGAGITAPGIGIGQAIAGSYGLVKNVRAFGAVGDGVADDTSAINAAISNAAATGGGIVYFPPGTYRTAGSHSLGPTVSLVGAGSTASTLMLDNLAAAFLIRLQPGAADRYQVISNLATAATNSTPGAQVINVQNGARCIFYNLSLDGTNFAGDLISLANSVLTDVLFDTCVMRLSSSGRAIVVTGGVNGLRRGIVRCCRIITPAAYSQGSVMSGRNFYVDGCLFENDATTSGTYSCIVMTSGASWRVTNCEFTSGGVGSTVTAMDFGSYSASSSIHESNNVFGTTVTAYAYTATGGARGAQISLRSREQRSIFVTDNGAAPILPIDQYGLVVLSTTNAGLTTFAAARQPPDGSRGTIVVAHPSAGTVLAGANFLNPTTTTTATGLAHIWEYRVCTPASTVRMALIVDGRSLGATL
jgi:hypothetical protein